MSGTGAKIVYCIGLLLLAACAVIPQPQTPTLTAMVISAPLSTEGRLARAMHARIALEAAGEMHDYRLTELAGEIDGLRRLAFDDDAEGARGELVDALADELSAALAHRAKLDERGGVDETDLKAADGVVRGLTAAINAEVRGTSA